MRTDFEETIAGTLQGRHTQAVDVAALRAGSLTRARRIRRRRTGLTGAAAAIVLTAAGIAVAAGPGNERPPAIGAATSGPAATVMTHLPQSAHPGALTAPQLVGTDPGTLHFDVDTAVTEATQIFYSTRRGLEVATVATRPTALNTIWFYLATDPAVLAQAATGPDSRSHDAPLDVEVAGRAATMLRYPDGFDGTHPVYDITWQPAGGLWAKVQVQVQVQVQTDGAAAALRTAAAFRLERAQRCVVPFRLAPLPAGYTWTGCTAALGPAKPWELGAVVLDDGKGNEITVGIGNLSIDGRFTPNTTAGGRPAQWLDEAQHPSVMTDGTTTGVSTTPAHLFVPLGDWVNLDISPAAGPDNRLGPLTQAVATQLAGLVFPGPDFADPATWPDSPVG